MIVKYSLGLDVSSKDIKACISVIDNTQHVKVRSSITILNTKKGLESLLVWIKKWHGELAIPISVCMEATGVYHESCAYFLNEKGYRVSIILPNKAKKYLQSLGLKSKNDQIDAKGLAQMGAEQKLDQWVPIGSFYYELRILTRQHQSLQESVTAEKNRLHAAEAAHLQLKFEIKQIQKHIKFLQNQIDELELEIKQLMESDEEMHKKFQNVTKIYGIALISCATVVAECGGFLLFKNFKQLVSYAGYDVVENQSGNSFGKTRISKKGNSRIRRILHMPSLVALRNKDSIFTKLYVRILERTGIKMKGIVAVQKKLLTTIFFVWKNNLDFDTNLHNIQKEEQVATSPLALQKPQKKAIQKCMASQGKHPVSNHSMPPLRKVKIVKEFV